MNQSINTDSNRTFLHINRMKIMAQEVFKILHNLSPVNLQDLVNFKVSNYNFRKENQAEVNSIKHLDMEQPPKRHQDCGVLSTVQEAVA